MAGRGSRSHPGTGAGEEEGVLQEERAVSFAQ